MRFRVRLKQLSGSNYVYATSPLTSSFSITDDNTGASVVQRTAEYYKQKVIFEFTNSYKCFINDKRQMLPKLVEKKAELTIDNCVGQEVQFTNAGIE